MKTAFGLFSFAVMALFIGSCTEQSKEEEEESSSRVLIINEGISPNGPGSLSEYDPSKMKVNNNVFAKSNIYTVGGSFISILNDGATIFAVINNKSKIYALDPEDYSVKYKEAIGFYSPRYMLHVMGNKYYVTDWGGGGGGNSVYVYNSKSNSITKTISVGIRPERMLLVNDTLVFVANSGGGPSDSLITVIHAYADTAVAQLEVGKNPNSLQMISDSTVLALGSGEEHPINPSDNFPGWLSIINTHSLQVDTIMYLTDKLLRPHSLVADEARSVFYFLDLNKGANVMKYNPSTMLMPVVPFISGSYNAIGYDQLKKEIYVSDPLDELSAGKVFRYDNTGALIDEFSVGIIPKNFAFLLNKGEFDR